MMAKLKEEMEARLEGERKAKEDADREAARGRRREEQEGDAPGEKMNAGSRAVRAKGAAGGAGTGLWDD